jgi:hypothetical protein
LLPLLTYKNSFKKLFFKLKQNKVQQQSIGYTQPRPTYYVPVQKSSCKKSTWCCAICGCIVVCGIIILIGILTGFISFKE